LGKEIANGPDDFGPYPFKWDQHEGD
jgi:hypothetical protein